MTDINDTRSDDTVSTRTDEFPELAEFRTTAETSFADISGLEEKKKRLERTVLASIRARHDDPANTALFYGYRNAGASRIADAVAHALQEEGFTTYHIPLDDAHGPPGNVRPLVHYLEQACRADPCVLRIDDLENARLGRGTPARNVIERIQDDCPRIALVGVATLPERPHRTVDVEDVVESQWPDVRLHIEPPGTRRRRAILEDELERHCNSRGVDLESDALDLEMAVDDCVTGGLTLLKTVAKRAAIRAATNADADRLRSEHVQTAAANVADEWNFDSKESKGSPYSKGDGSVEELVSPTVPEISFADVGGLDGVKRRLQELLIYPEQYAELFERSGVDLGHGVVLHGPPGTGKTLLAKAVANATDRSFLAVQGPELKNKWFGETERRIREVIELADEYAPSVLFFDEFDAIAGARDDFTHEANGSIVATLLTELDGLEDRREVLFLAATNRLNALDDAIRRSGRFGETVAVPLPDREGREEIFGIHAEGLPTEQTVTPSWFADSAPEGLSGADVETICKQALYEAIRDEKNGDDDIVVQRSHIRSAIEVVCGDDTTSRPRSFA